MVKPPNKTREFVGGDYVCCVWLSFSQFMKIILSIIKDNLLIPGVKGDAFNLKGLYLKATTEWIKGIKGCD